jgi:hypothetical protein
VNITNANEKAAAQSFIGALMATDSAGNKHALARRMGIMYVIWDRQIWSAYRASEGWRPYSGASAHRDHVHISLSWAGANGRTSFWSGTVPPDLPTASPVTSNASSSRRSASTGTSSSRRTGSGRSTGGTTASRSWGSSSGHNSGAPQLSRDQLRQGVGALYADGTPPSAAEIAAWLVANGASQTWADQYASWTAERAAQHADSQSRSGWTPPTTAEDRDWEQERAEREAEAQRQREAWAERRAAEQERQREEWEQRQAEEAERRAATTTTTRPTCTSDRHHRWGRDRGCIPASTTIPPTTSTTRPVTTTVAPTTTTTAAPTTTTAAPTTTTAAPTTTTAAPVTTTTGG